MVRVMENFTALSYGGGVQTFGIAVLIEAGLIPKPDIIIFADTQNEEISTYQHIGEIAIPLFHRLEIPFRVITHGNLYRDSILSNHTPNPPICTKTYKIRPIEKFLTRYVPNGIIDVIIGISTDEENRSNSKSENKRINKTYPLIALKLSRDNIIDYIKQAGYSVPEKSGCFFCPWKSKEFLKMKQFEPDKFNACLNLEISTGHKLPKYGTSLSQIDKQLFFEIEDNCSSGYCGV